MTKIGIQNSVMGFDDPFHPESCKKYMRTGERQFFPSQDKTPSVSAYMHFLKDVLKADFSVHHIMPDLNECKYLCDEFAHFKMEVILGNEFGNINGIFSKESNRFDIPKAIYEYALYKGVLGGVLYDETEHLQLHKGIYNGEYNQWLNEGDYTLSQAENALVDNVQKVLKQYDCKKYSEHVFPVFYHLFARGGFELCPKVLKEEYFSYQLSIACGAAKQYSKGINFCVDLWGFDIGNWFTRLWGFPAHSPDEFLNALKICYLYNPDMMFVENIDILCRSLGESFTLTEFGDKYLEFRKWAKGITLPYEFSDIDADIAVIKRDDGVFSAHGTFDNRGAFGFEKFGTQQSVEFFYAMHALSFGTYSKFGNSFWRTDHTDFPTGGYARNQENIKTLPLSCGVEGNHKLYHKLFYPLNNTLVYDNSVTYDIIKNAKLVIVCADELSETTKAALIKIRQEGATVVTLKSLPETFGTSFESFDSAEFKEFVSEFSGQCDTWQTTFGNKVLEVTNPCGDGITLNWQIKDKA